MDQLVERVPFGLAVLRSESADPDDSLTLLFHNQAASRPIDTDLSAALERPLSAPFPRSPIQMRIIATIRQGVQQALGRFTCHTGPIAHRLSGTMLPVAADCALALLEKLQARGRAECEARSMRQLVDATLDHVPAMIFLKDAVSLRFVRCNRAAEELLGVPQSSLRGKTDHDLFPKAQADRFVAADREVLRSKVLKDIPREPIETPTGLRWLHTRKIPILDEQGVPRHLLGVSIDVTDQQRAEEVLRSSHEALEQRVRERTAELERQISQRVRAEELLARTEEQLRHTQKMEAIGRLAGGVAHDFNNLLSVVVGYSDLMLAQMPEQAPLRKHVEQISQAGVRAANLTRQLLAFSRRQVIRPRVIDLNQVLGGLEEMLSRLVGEHIDVQIHRSERPPYVEADPSQIEQVIMNLVVNARDAMPCGGRLTIETAHVELDAAFTATHVGATPGPHVKLSVSDTGIGMDASTLLHIFEPFFTTKEVGKGTGLGLSTVFAIVKQRQGVVRASSQPGHGATFDVYLPLSSDARHHASPPKQPAQRPQLRGSETILLVEHQEPVRALAATCLRELGYRVIEAAGAAEATRKAQLEPFQLLLTDVTMPDMTGTALAAQLLRRDPGLRVLFMSGQLDDGCTRGDVLNGRPLIHKPITPGTLAERVREVLEGSTMTASASDQLSPA
jgi:PAS domain S-box-containing protein